MGVLADEALRGLRGLVAGANEPDIHLRGVEPGRDFEPAWGDVRTVEAGDTDADGSPIRIEPAIEVGNIFKLGTRYSSPARRDLSRRARQGAARSGWAPTASARRGSSPPRSSSSPTTPGISWPRSLAPFDVELVTLGKEGEPARDDRRPALRGAARARSRRALRRPRRLGAGEKFADAELLGCPLRLTVGKRRRRGGRGRGPGAARAGEAIAAARGSRGGGRGAVARARLTRKRLLGLDRSGATAAGDARRASRSTRGRCRTRSASCGSRSSRCSWCSR